jgi:hypothetical protein
LVDTPRTSKTTPKRHPSNARDYAKEDKAKARSRFLDSRAPGTCPLLRLSLKTQHNG